MFESSSTKSKISYEECKNPTEDIEETFVDEKKSMGNRVLVKKCSSISRMHANLSWKDVTYTVNVKGAQGKYKKKILDNISGHAEAGEILAIMGPSGSGKTTLLEALSNVLGRSGKISGDIKINDRNREEKHKHMMQYIASDDKLSAYMTVYENLKFGCQFAGIPAHEIKDKIEKILDDTGLTTCRDTKVGNLTLKGISHGQQRRLTFALGLAYSSPIILADEATSGLDAASAVEIIKVLKCIASGGHTIVCTIHQPATQISALFDKVSILTGGRTAYFGSNENMVPYFDKLGYTCPNYANPSDYILEIVNVDFSKSTDVDLVLENWERSEDSKMELQDIERIQKTLSTKKEQEWMEDQFGYKTSYLRQFSILFSRDFQNNYKNPVNYISRIFVCAIFGLLVGCIYYDLENKNPIEFPNDLISRQMALVITIITALMISMMMLPSYIDDRCMFYRERINGAYAPVPYCMAKFLSGILPMFITAATLTSCFALLSGFNGFWTMMLIFFASMVCFETYTCFISTFTNSIVLSFVLTGGFLGYMILNCGSMASPESVMFPLGYIAYIDFMFYSFRALMTNEFIPIKFDYGIPDFTTGNDYLISRGLDGGSITDDLLMILYMTIVNVIVFTLAMQFLHTGKK